MSSRERVQLSQRVLAATAYLGKNPEELHPHYEWMLKELMGRVSPADLTVEETMALVAILVPAHSRKLEAAGSADPATDVGMLSGGRLRLVTPLRQPLVEGPTGVCDSSPAEPVAEFLDDSVV